MKEKEQEYEYWTPGRKKPDSLPEGCERAGSSWYEEAFHPSAWLFVERRWPKPDKEEQE